jgi:hypothetical protein
MFRRENVWLVCYLGLVRAVRHHYHFSWNSSNSIFTMVASDCSKTMDDGSDIESDDYYGGSSEDEENVNPKKTPSTNKAVPKKAPTMKFKMKVPTTAAVENEHAVAALGSTTNTIHNEPLFAFVYKFCKWPTAPNFWFGAPKIPQKEKTVEERYREKSQLERILLRPDAYSTFLLSFTPLRFIHLRFNGTFSLNRLK